ncbi:MAG: leucine-rich repeat domain-containing protein [Methanomassiliicoccaceae archaeon]|nr:leucine-rich repeat domain-containing protein [Methanomassiliicoccaceae archaeon]
MKSEKEVTGADNAGKGRRTAVLALAAVFILSASAMMMFVASGPQGNDSSGGSGDGSDQKLGYTGTGETFYDWCGREYEVISAPPEGTAAMIDNHGYKEGWVSIWMIESDSGSYAGELFYIVAVADGVFAGDDVIYHFEIPTLKEIGDNAFEGCTDLGSFQLESIEHIGEDAFKGCTSLVWAVIGGIATIGDNAFEGCNALEIVSLRYGTSIDGSGIGPYVMKVYFDGTSLSAGLTSDYSVSVFAYVSQETPFVAIFVNDEMRVMEWYWYTDMYFTPYEANNYELYIEFRAMYRVELVDNDTGDNIGFSYVAEGRSMTGGDVLVSGVASEAAYIPEGFDVTVRPLQLEPGYLFGIDSDNVEYQGSDPNAYVITGPSASVDAIDGDIKLYADGFEYTTGTVSERSIPYVPVILAVFLLVLLFAYVLGKKQY